MRIYAISLLICVGFSLQAQTELHQQLKLIDVSTDNNLTSLLGRDNDNIISEREISHFIINYFLGLPNGIVTLVEAGESFDNLLAAGATTSDLLNSGLFGPCDGGFAIDSNDPIDAANAIGLCYGLVAAEWVSPDGTPPPNDPDFDIGHGIKDNFGTQVIPTQGDQILLLSTGAARDPLDPGFNNDLSKGYVSNFPVGFPYNHPVCGITDTPNDGIGLKVTVNVPSFVTSLSFDYRYFTHDFPDWICAGLTTDQPMVMVSPDPGGTVPTGNVLIDGNNHPVSVNSQDVITVCNSGATGYPCGSGTNDLAVTGFETEGGSEWITITFPVTGNTMIEIVFAIWDSRDNALTSTLLLDNVRWNAI